jgi:asparagine synthase (glutamine-hydrolysing)
MQIKLILKYNNGFRWFSKNNIYLKGYAYVEDTFLTGQDLLDFIDNKLVNNTPYDEWIKSLNGVFSFIICSEKSLTVYSDKTRFFPLFYTTAKNLLLVSDEPYELIEGQSVINTPAAEEFRRTGYVTGYETLFKNINQVQAGELLQYKDEKFVRKCLFSFRVKKDEIFHYDNPVAAMKSYLDNAFQRLSISLAGKVPVIPLSGGFDSRLIATKIKEFGFDNAICFTYGRPSKEVEISKEVARHLGFKWFFINYEEILSDRVIIQEEEFLKYYPYASRGTSMFYLQEFPATEYLKKNKLIPENSVFLPGHSGDLLGGSQFIKVFPPEIAADKVAEQILRTKYSLYPTNKELSKTFYQRIQIALDEISAYHGYSVFEDYDIREKIAKFIFNSSQVFTYFGYEVRFPFWDDELVNFIRTFPPEYRIGKKIYDQCLKENYFSKNGVNYPKELQPGLIKFKIQTIKDLIKPFLPAVIKKKFIRKHDWTCYTEMSKPMLAELGRKQRVILPWKFNNSILINWYLMKINSGNTLR